MPRIIITKLKLVTFRYESEKRYNETNQIIHRYTDKKYKTIGR